MEVTTLQTENKLLKEKYNRATGTHSVNHRHQHVLYKIFIMMHLRIEIRILRFHRAMINISIAYNVNEKPSFSSLDETSK